MLPGTFFVDSLSAASDALRLSPDAAVIVDPLAQGCTVESLTSLRAQVPGASFVVYTALDPRHFQVVADLVRAGFSDIVLAGYDDTPERFERLLGEIACRAPFLPFAEAIELPMARLPKRLRSAVEDMLRNPRRYRCTLDLAAAARLSKRAVFRHLTTAGFGSPRRLVASARVLRAYLLLRDENRSIREVALRLGYRSPAQLAQHFTELSGCTPSEARMAMSTDAFAQRVAAAITGPVVSHHVLAES